MPNSICSEANALSKYNVVIFDFDGVILDSNGVKELAFQAIFDGLTPEQNLMISSYHQENLGVARNKKISHFYRELYGQDIGNEELQMLCEKFSKASVEELSQSHYLIKDSIGYITSNSFMQTFYVASAANEYDLKRLCKIHNIERFFRSIYGGPREKADIVKEISSNHSSEEVALIGDSIHDMEAAKVNGIQFFGYNNCNLVGLCSYLDRLEK